MSLVTHELAIESEEKRCIVIVKDLCKTSNHRFSLILSPSTTCSKLHAEISKKVYYMVGTFDVVWTNPTDGNEIGMDENDQNSIFRSGFSMERKNYVEIRERSGVAVEMLHPSTICETEGTGSSTVPEPPPFIPTKKLIWKMLPSDPKIEQSTPDGDQQNDCASELVSLKMLKLVGLVNQAMTCYLNSLIQTLYMTPEFRNALYRWECDSPSSTSTSIPYQLQHLFLLLQTSDKQSVETTGLTRSFGWDSSEAWQQHDIQELCRVMFDALEKKFEGTDQADLIKQLYAGTMLDYVQCCACSHRSAREDTFLDVPINIKQSNKTYKSVMEGLTAFVEPETLNESNQYYCEKCEMKCDALKGLKFTKFPYLLTLQLKRFDFDYSTMHRVKLNDRMTFPQILNLNSFIEKEEITTSEADSVNDENDEIPRLDSELGDEDASSHDSGHDFEQTSSMTVSGGGDSFPPNQRNSSEEEGGSSVDEGIDVESQMCSTKKKRKNSSNWWIEQEEIDSCLKEGPYVYELFSIMVHSGSAAGGHYYAYIKSFENNQWYSFNDQIVSAITHLDIEKTFGGSPYSRSSSYYSSFSSSTNAYMLMYRQINPSVNAGFMQEGDFPLHIVKLLERKEEEERFRKMKMEQERNMCSIRLFCRHPSLLKHLVRTSVEENFVFHKDISLTEAVQQAHRCLKLDSDLVPLALCRLVKYDHINDVLDRSYDVDSEDAQSSLSQLLGGAKTTYLFDLLLETRKADETFERYERGGVTVKVHVADHQEMCFRDPIFVRVIESQTVGHLKAAIATRVQQPLERLLVAYEKYNGDCQLLQQNKRTLKDEGFFRSAKVFVDSATDEEMETMSEKIHLGLQLENTFLFTIMDRIANIITVNIALPPEPIEVESTKPSVFNTSDYVNPKTTNENVVSSSSSDEGVGSLGGGSGNERSSPLGTADTASKSTPTYPPGSEDDGDVPKRREIDLTPSEISCFWQIPELSNSSFSHTIDTEERHKGGRKRNNSFDSDVAESSELPSDLTEQLQERLEDYVSDMSPTSSLKCEDGNSSHSGQNSFITDMDFEGDALAATDEMTDLALNDTTQQPAPVGSERSSLSTSCSTLDSTDTLCNPVEPTSNKHEENLVASLQSARPSLTPQYSTLYRSAELTANEVVTKSFEARPTKPLQETLQPDCGPLESLKPILTQCYPVGAVTCSERLPIDTTSDYTKALQYVDGTMSATSAFQNNQHESMLMNVAGTGDPSDSNAELEKAPFNNDSAIITSEPSKSAAAWDENMIVASQCTSFVNSGLPPHQNNTTVSFCSSSTICVNCGAASQLSSPVTNCFHSGNSKSPVSELKDPTSDPESGEGVDNLKPLFSDSNLSKTSSTQANYSDALHAGSVSENSSRIPDNRNYRERTVSTSSIASDGWGMSTDMLQTCNYFKINSTSYSSSTPSLVDGETLTTKVISVEIDKRMSLLTLKKNLAPIICTPTRRFCIYKVYASGQEVEMYTPTDNFKTTNSGTNFTVKFGRALRQDEYRCKLFRLALDEEEPAKFFMNWIVQRGMTVEVAKNLLANDMAEQYGIHRDPERIRIRKKTWRSPGQVYLSSDVFGTNISLYGSLEFFVELLEEPEKKTKQTDLVVLCRRWSPAALQFSDFHEVVLNDDKEVTTYLGYSLQHLRTKLAEISNIAEDDLLLAKGRGMFPYRTSVLCADGDLEWVPSQRNTFWQHLSDDGIVIYYKDRTEKLKVCTSEERQEIEAEEQKFDSSICSNKTSTKGVSYSPNRPSYRREKALKIYTVDTAPSKEKDSSIAL